MFSRVKKAFLAEYFNEQENERYNLARHNFGTKVATFMAAYNLLLIRQRVLKNAIHFTKSNNPLIVKMVLLPLPRLPSASGLSTLPVSSASG